MKDIKLEVLTDVDTCDCCGRSDLRRVISITVDGTHVGNYGTTCAARFIPAVETRVKKLVQQFDREETARRTLEADKMLNIVEVQAKNLGITLEAALARLIAYKPAARDLLIWRYELDRFSISIPLRESLRGLK